jgi:hypothetical protein
VAWSVRRNLFSCDGRASPLREGPVPAVEGPVPAPVECEAGRDIGDSPWLQYSVDFCRTSKKSFTVFQSQSTFPIRSLPCHQVRSESETQLTRVKQVKSARVTIRQTHVAYYYTGRRHCRRQGGDDGWQNSATATLTSSGP